MMTTMLMHRTPYLLPDGTPVIALVRAGKTAHEWQFVDPATGDPRYLLDGTQLRRFTSLDPVALAPTDLQLDDLRVDTSGHAAARAALRAAAQAAADAVRDELAVIDIPGGSTGQVDQLAAIYAQRPVGMCLECGTICVAAQISVAATTWSRHFACPCGHTWTAAVRFTGD